MDRSERGGFARFWPDDVSFVDDLTAVGWLRAAERWRPFKPGPAMTRASVPDGFARYLRINHPAGMREGGPFPHAMRPVPWSTVAAWAGKPLESVSFFSDLVADAAPAAPGPPYTDPPDDRLPDRAFSRLLQVLCRHTKTPERLWLSFWEGSGPGQGELLTAVEHPAPRQDYEDHAALRARIAALPRWSPPGWARAGRRYWLAEGTAGGLLQLAASRWPPYQPNFWWPDDHAWIAGRENDFRFTVVGLDVPAAEQLLAQRDLEIWPVR